MGNAAMENLDLAAAALLGNNRAEAKLVEKKWNRRSMIMKRCSQII